MSETGGDKKFLGQGWSFPPEFTRFDGGLYLKSVVEEEDIRESLRILLSTRPGERVMQPAYGCGIQLKVFESINDTTITEIKDIIERAVLFFEPRISLESIDVDTSEAMDGKLSLQLNYQIRRTNTRSNIVYPFYFLEGTNVRS